MKRFLFSVVLAIVFAFTAKGQATTAGVFSKGTNVISAGVGIGGYYNYLSTSYSESPSFTLIYENSTVDPFASGMLGLGGIITYQSTSNTWTDGYTYSDKYNFELVAFRMAYHYRVRSVAKLDLSGGITLGYLFYQHNFTSNDPLVDHPSSPGYTAYSGATGNTHLQYGLYADGRYYFGNVVGLYAEIVIMNNGYNYIGLGLSFKLQ